MKRTLMVAIEIGQNGWLPKESAQEFCGRLEQVLKSNEFVPTDAKLTLLHDSTGKLRPEQVVWKVAQERVQDILKPTYFDEVPILPIRVNLEMLGIEFGENIAPAGSNNGDGRSIVRLHFGDSDRALTLIWHRMEATGHYEVIGYVS